MADREQSRGRQMKKYLREIKWRRLLFPSKRLLLSCIFVSFLLLAVVFLFGWDGQWFAYIVYAFSTYSIVAFCARLPGLIAHSRTIERVQQFLSTNPITKRYYLDVSFQAFINLVRTLGINFVFVVIKVFYAIKYSSAWFGALAVYYLALCGIRLFLARRVHRRMGEDGYDREWKDYRIAGLSLLGLNVTVTGFVVQMIRHGKGYEYPGVLIYAVAAYTFYCVIMSVVNAIGKRKRKSPVLSAVRLIDLSTAGVTVFNLQTAMQVQFGHDAGFIHTMNTVTGTGVCVFIMGIAIYMLFRAGIRNRME